MITILHWRWLWDLILLCWEDTLQDLTKVLQNGKYQWKLYEGILGRRKRQSQKLARYDMGGDKKLSFEEGVDSFVPYAGSLKDNVTPDPE